MKLVWLAGVLLGTLLVACVSLSSKPAQAQAVCTQGSPYTDQNGVSCCTNQLVSPGYGQAPLCPGSVAPGSSTRSVQGFQAPTAVAGASVRITRSYLDALSQQYEGGDLQGAFGSSSQPAGAAPLAYAPLDSFEARYPVLKAPPAPDPKPYRFFVTSFGGGFSDNQVFSQNGSFGGGLIGVDYRVNGNLLVGASVGGSSASVSLPSAAGSTTGVNGTVFAIGTAGAFYAQSLTTISGFSNDTTRLAATGGATPAIERASFGSTEIRTRAEFGRVVDLGDFPSFPKAKITPFVALEIAQLHLDGHAENNVNGTGNAFGVVTLGQDVNDVPAFIGARLEASYKIGNGMTLTPILRLAYVHQFANSEVTVTNLLAGGGTSFSPNGTLLGRNSAQTKAGFELSIGRGVVVFANFDGLFSSTDQLYGGRGGIRISY